MSVSPTAETTHDATNTTTAARAVTREFLVTEGIVADASLVAAGPASLSGGGVGAAGILRGR